MFAQTVGLVLQLEGTWSCWDKARTFQCEEPSFLATIHVFTLFLLPNYIDIRVISMKNTEKNAPLSSIKLAPPQLKCVLEEHPQGHGGLQNLRKKRLRMKK